MKNVAFFNCSIFINLINMIVMLVLFFNINTNQKVNNSLVENY